MIHITKLSTQPIVKKPHFLHIKDTHRYSMHGGNFAFALSVYAWVARWLVPEPAVDVGTSDHVPIYMRAPSQGYAPAYPTQGAHGAVTCEVDVCSYVGAYLLSKGGSAADAAIGASACVGVINAFHSGIGGGGYALVKTNKSEPIMVDYRETAPDAAFREMFVNGTEEEMIHGCVSDD